MSARPPSWRVRWELAAVAALVATTAQAQTAPITASDGITPALIQVGALLFRGPGLCASCHGADAGGIDGLAPNLRDTVWLHSKGTLPDVVNQILTGVPSNRSSTGVSMPPRGGSRLTEEQVRAVAAYVWSLSHSAPEGPATTTP